MTEAMPFEDKPILPASISDYEELVGILDRANEYARDRSGEPMWTSMDHVYNQLRGHLEIGDCFVLRSENNKISAVIMLTDKDGLWGDKSNDESALYLHKLMKDPDNSIRDSGLMLLSFASREAIKRNKKFLRCDTKPNQVQLVDYYYKLGFVSKGSFAYRTTGKEGIFLEAEPSEVLKLIAKQL